MKVIVNQFFNGEYSEVHIVNIGKRTNAEFLKNRKNQGFVEIERPKVPLKLIDKNGAIEANNLEIDLTRYIVQKKDEYKNNISRMLENKANELGFESFYTASAYLTQGDNPLKPLAERLGIWGGNVWGKSMEIQAQVQSGEIDMPQTWEELKGMLPQWEE